MDACVLMGETIMKRSLLPGLALILPLVAAIVFTGCDSGLASKTDTAALNVGRAAVGAIGPGTFSPAAVSGTLTVFDGEPVVRYQGNNFYVKGSLPIPGEGTAVTITGEAAPILGQDEEGNSLFFGYYLNAGKISVNE
jgi:hypothetical protein